MAVNNGTTVGGHVQSTMDSVGTVTSCCATGVLRLDSRKTKRLPKDDVVSSLHLNSDICCLFTVEAWPHLLKPSPVLASLPFLSCSQIM